MTYNPLRAYQAVQGNLLSFFSKFGRKMTNMSIIKFKSVYNYKNNICREGRQIFLMSNAQKIFAGEDDMGLGGNDGSVATGNAGT